MSVVLEGPSAPFTAHLVVPTGPGPHPLVVHVPGVGMHGVMDGLALVGWGVGDGPQSSLVALGMGTLSITVDVDDDGAPRLDIPRSELTELIRIAAEWAASRSDVATAGHVVVGTDFGVAAASVLGGELSAELVFWHWPEMRTVGEYLEDEVLRRDWFRRRRGDEDGDGVLSAEEWGVFRATSSSPEDAGVSLAEVDQDGDGVYSLADAELQEAAAWSEMRSLLEGDDRASWTAFWKARERTEDAERWQGHPALAWPSPAWARDAWDGPRAWPQLAADGPPILIFRDSRDDPMVTPLPRSTELGRADFAWGSNARLNTSLWSTVHSCLRVRRDPSPADDPGHPCRPDDP